MVFGEGLALARFALSAALGDTPGWFDPASPEPAAKDYATREVNQFLWASNVDFPFLFALRAKLEFRAGGNPSWNTGVDYRKRSNRFVDREEVRALYKQAGLSLDADLDALNEAARITANSDSVFSHFRLPSESVPQAISMFASPTYR